MAFTALGQAQATAGKVNDAMATLEQGLAMRRRYPVGPWGWIHHLMVMSRVAVQAGVVPISVGLVGASAIILTRAADHSWAAVVITLATAATAYWSRWNPLWLIGIAGLAGLTGFV